MKALKTTVFVFVFAAASIVLAGVPDEFNPVVVEAPFSFTKRVFDLTPATNKSIATGKPILLYFGAADCPPCRQYEQFLSKNVDQMKLVLSNYVFVDVRSWLKSPSIYIKVNNDEYPFKEWRETTGDSRVGLFWPTWWVLNSDLKQLKQMPSGSGNFLTVKKHSEILSLSKPY